ncbi:MAG TPA: hypothetical protein VM818_00965 [Vicinamibacterales bacterium]|nr:hypothetical protein [Vicinamibacterales bacterium]
MTSRRMAGVFSMALLLLGARAPDADGQMFVSTGRDTLRGLPGVEVLVEGLQPELQQSGLTVAAIRADVERRLRDGGISVYASQSTNPSLAKAYLYVHLNALVLPQDAGYAIAVQVHLRQTLRSPVTGSNVVNAMTWDAQNVLGVPASALQTVRAEVLTFVDQFVKDWAAVH